MKQVHKWKHPQHCEFLKGPYTSLSHILVITSTSTIYFWFKWFSVQRTRIIMHIRKKSIWKYPVQSISNALRVHPFYHYICYFTVLQCISKYEIRIAKDEPFIIIIVSLCNLNDQHQAIYWAANLAKLRA